MSAADFFRRLKTPRQRSELLTELRFRKDAFQAASFTVEDRYPVLFAECARLLAHIVAPRILSFGCSTGEEAFSLQRHLPQARILGVDINRWCLRQAIRRNTSPMIRFAEVDSEKFRQASGFDAIFCMAVFQQAENRTDRVETIQSGLTFARFDRELHRLHGKLRPGGLLFLDHADFLFTDTAVSEKYEPVLFPGSARTRDRPMFDRDNRRVAETYTVERCFRKRVFPADAHRPAADDSAALSSKLDRR